MIFLEAVHTFERIFAFLRLPFSLPPAFPSWSIWCICGCIRAFCVCATLDTDSIVILVSRKVRVAVLVAAQLLLLGGGHVCSRRRSRHFPLGHIPPPPSRFLPPRAGPPPHRRQARPAGACRKAAASATAAAPPTVANRAQPPRRACVRPRHTAEKGARARAPSRTASWLLPVPWSRRAVFPPPSRHFAPRRRICRLRGQGLLRPASPPAPRHEAELKGLLPRPLPCQDVSPAIGSILRSPTRCKRAKVCGLDQTTSAPERGGRQKKSPFVLGVSV